MRILSLKAPTCLELLTVNFAAVINCDSCFKDCQTYFTCFAFVVSACGLRLKRDGTRAETRFSLSGETASPFKSAGGRQFSRLLAAEVCVSAVVMRDTPCSEGV